MEQKISPEDRKLIREFKVKLFEMYWEKFGTFYMHLVPHPNLVIGSRGLLKEEKETGIVLVFGPQAVKEVNTDKEFLFAELQFGFKWEKLVIPWDSIFRIYDKSQYSITQMRVFSDEIAPQEAKDKPASAKVKQSSSDPKVIEVDFTKK